MLRFCPRLLAPLRLLAAFLAIPLLAALSHAASAQEWAIDKQKSRISFEVEAGGQAFTGQFDTFEAEIHFQRTHLDEAEIAATIDMNTVNTGQPKVNDALMTNEWFDTQTFPTAGFKSTAISAGSGESSYVMKGNLTIKGKTRPVTLPFTLAVDEGDATATGETAISRREFGIGPDGPVSGYVIGDVIKVRLDIVAKRLDN
jgi:polyisoprenoid-binding protein YceI